MPLPALIEFLPWISDARFSILMIRRCPQEQTDLLSVYDAVRVCTESLPVLNKEPTRRRGAGGLHYSSTFAAGSTTDEPCFVGQSRIELTNVVADNDLPRLPMCSLFKASIA